MHSVRGSEWRRITWYGLTVFLSSAILLVLEITAGRLIAPYVGVSIYSWTSIIGVILAGLSLGNWLGGRWADNGAGERAVGLTLALAGTFSLFSLLVLGLVAPILQTSELNLVGSTFLYVLSMFFVPSILLGIPTPVLTTLALRMDQRAGHIVGRMHALAALGSIIGTFITGFLLIQYFGSRMVIMSSAILLLLMAAPFFRRGPRTVPMAILTATLFMGVAINSQGGFTNPCDHESNYYCLRVVDTSGQSLHGSSRALILDHLLHGENHETEPGLLLSSYVHLIDELVLQHFDVMRRNELDYFFAGGGAYTQPRAIRALSPRARVTVAELDNRVTEVARDQLYVPTSEMRIFHGDARMVLRKLVDERFDVIVTDAFHDIAIPYHLVTHEYVKLVKSRLREDGLYATNVVDAFPDPKMVKSIYKTLLQEFSYVDVWVDRVPRNPQRLTYVISASNSPIQSNTLKSQRGLTRFWYRANTPLTTTGTRIESLPVFTDDYVPVERMIAGLLLGKEGR